MNNILTFAHQQSDNCQQELNLKRLIHTCAAISMLVAIALITNFVYKFSITLRVMWSEPSVRQFIDVSYVVSIMAGIAMMKLLSLSSARLFAMRRWAGLSVATLGWLSIVPNIGNLPYDDWKFYIILFVTLSLTFSLVRCWQQLKSGF